MIFEMHSFHHLVFKFFVFARYLISYLAKLDQQNEEGQMQWGKCQMTLSKAERRSWYLGKTSFHLADPNGLHKLAQTNI